jgi:hypothetical protein
MKPELSKFLHVPQTEQEVVGLFVALLDDIDELEKPVIIERMQTGFPDCTVRAGTESIRIEFELYGSNFDHDCSGCDMLVCWRDDRNDWDPGFRVVELATVVATKHTQDLFVSLDEQYPSPWNEETFFAAMRRDGTNPHDIALARTVIKCARERKWGPIWLVNPKPVFAVGTPQYFKVYSTGRIGFPFCRLDAGDRFSELAQRLNRVVPALRVRLVDAGSKRKGGQLASLFESEQAVVDFFDAWSWFRSH